jgi:hypothetical protein
MKRPSETLDLNAFEKFITAVGEYGHAQHQSKSLKERFFGEKHGEELVNLSREVFAVVFLAITSADQSGYSDALKQAVSFVRMRID